MNSLKKRSYENIWSEFCIKIWMNYYSAVFLILWLPCTNTFNIGFVSAYNTLIRRSLATSLVQGWKYLVGPLTRHKSHPPRLPWELVATWCFYTMCTKEWGNKNDWQARLSLEAQQATGPTRNSVWVRQVTHFFGLACSDWTGSYSLRWCEWV